jgi:phospholipase C
VSRNFTQYQSAPEKSALFEHAMRQRSLQDLLSDLRSGNLPQVTWILPPWYANEHPDNMPAAGERYTHRIPGSVVGEPQALGEDGAHPQLRRERRPVRSRGSADPGAGTPGEFVRGVPIGLGFRVPCLVISPFSRGGYVCSDTFDHTSVLRLIEARFGVEVPNISEWRRRASGDLTRAFGFGEPARLDCPSHYPIRRGPWKPPCTTSSRSLHRKCLKCKACRGPEPGTRLRRS